MTSIFAEYYEIENTVDEWYSQVTARWLNYEQAYKDLANHSNWYERRGTGTIFKVTLKIEDDGRIMMDRERIQDM